MANLGEPHSVKAIHGKDETRRFLESLGFVAGAEVTVVTEMGGNVILNIKDTRVAIKRQWPAVLWFKAETDKTR
jgi:ferrous iron transport protein A